MKRKMLLIPLALIALSLVAPVRAGPAWYINWQGEIMGFEFAGVVPDGILFDVTFVGVAGGPDIKGTVMGVDHILIDWENIAHLDAYYTITDKDGDKISVHVTGIAYSKNPGHMIVEDSLATIINVPEYPTTGKYVGLVDNTFRNEGFLTDVSVDPPGGYIHAKLYW